MLTPKQQAAIIHAFLADCTPVTQIAVQLSIPLFDLLDFIESDLVQSTMQRLQVASAQQLALLTLRARANSIQLINAAASGEQVDRAQHSAAAQLLRSTPKSPKVSTLPPPPTSQVDSQPTSQPASQSTSQPPIHSTTQSTNQPATQPGPHSSDSDKTPSAHAARAATPPAPSSQPLPKREAA